MRRNCNTCGDPLTFHTAHLSDASPSTLNSTFCLVLQLDRESVNRNVKFYTKKKKKTLGDHMFILSQK